MQLIEYLYEILKYLVIYKTYPTKNNAMSIGNPKKFTLAEDLAKIKKEEKNKKLEDSVTRVYKKNDHRVKKELTFSTKKSKSKLV